MSGSLTISVAPTSEPITAEEQMTWSRVTDAADAALIERLIRAARQQCEFVTGRAFLTQTCVERFECFPCEFELARGPVQSVTSIQYFDTGNVERTLSSAYYMTDLYSTPAEIELAVGYSWPGTYSRPNAVTLTYVAGWQTTDDVPEGIKIAISLLVDFMFDNPTAGTGGPIPADVMSYLHPWVIYR